MPEAPSAGWYADPADSTRLRYWDGKAWSNQIRPAETQPGSKAPRHRLPGIAIVGIVFGALLTVGGFAAIILNATDKSDPTPTSASTPGSDVTPTPVNTEGSTTPEVIIPENWELFTSRSGAIQYAYDPAWTDIWTPEYEQAMVEGAGDLNGVEMEVAGSWLLDGSAWTGGTNLIIVASSDGTTPRMLGLQAQSFVQANAASVNGEDLEEAFDEGFTTANGYEAWRIDYTFSAYGSELYASVIAFQHDITIGFLYIASLEDFDVWTPGFLAVADSLVVIKPPVSP